MHVNFFIASFVFICLIIALYISYIILSKKNIEHLTNDFCKSLDGGVSLCQVKDGTFFHTRDNDQIVSDSIREGKAWEEWMHEYFKKYQDKDKVALDIGANIGAHTIYLSRYFKKVYSFEPQKNIFNVLKKNVEINNVQNVSLFNNGLGDREETVHMQYYDENQMVNQGAIGINNSDTNGEEIIVKRLDDYNFQDVGFIKLDVEGYEYQVLLGGMKTIQKHKPIIIIELWPYNKYNKEIREFFSSNGYTMTQISECDYLAIPKA